MIQVKNILNVIPELTSLGITQREEYATEIAQLIENSRDLLAIQAKYSEVLNRESQLSKRVDELKNRLFPSIYFGKAKHHTTKEQYIIARSMWKKGKNDYAQLSAYIGPVSNFPKGVNDDQVMKIALDKIRKKIREKFPMGD